MSENQPETIVLTSAADVGAFYGVSKTTVADGWRPRGMPCQPGSGGGKEGSYDVREIGRWLALRLRDAGAWSEPEPPKPTDEQLERQEIAGLVHSGEWRAALFRVLDWSLDQVASFENLASDIHWALGWHSHDFEHPVGGSVAIRFQGTRRFVWAGLSREFADGVCLLVNSGAAWLVPPSLLEYDEDCWRLDLPTAGNGETWDRWVLSTNPDHRGEASKEAVETVTKRTIRLIDDRWADARESLLESICDFDGLGLHTDAERRKWVSQLGERVDELKHRGRNKKGA